MSTDPLHIPGLTRPGEDRVAIAGDWHGNTTWINKILTDLHRAAPDVRTILHTGDFGIWPGAQRDRFLRIVDRFCRRAGIDQILVTPGNHEDWPRLAKLFADRPGERAQLSDVVWVLPRGHRFEIAGRSFLSFGGAASLDFADRRAGRDWWPEEMPSEEDVNLAIAEGSVEVLITHECVDGGTPAVERILRDNPLRWGARELEYAATSRERVTRVWEAVYPSVLAHGHLHVADGICLDDGRRVYSLGSDGQKRNVGLLRLGDLAWTWLEDVTA